MKRITFVALFLLSVSTLPAQTKSEDAVKAAVEELRVAMINGDSVMLDKLADQKLTYGHSSGHVDDRATFIHKLATGSSDFVSIDLTEQTIIISGKTAIVRHKLDAVTNDNGKPGDVHLLVMLVWQKSGGHWKLLARQAVKRQ